MVVTADDARVGAAAELIGGWSLLVRVLQGDLGWDEALPLALAAGR